jgi:outer membrane lipoprotein-sorting protein
MKLNWKTYNSKSSILIAIGMLTLTLGTAAAPGDAISEASSPTAKGLAIAIAADKADEGWGDWSADAEMILKNRRGQSSSRVMRMKALEQATDGDKRLIVFDHPRDVKGTAFLVFTKKVGNDDQWLYLPALKRVKRISSNNKSGPFVGSEFAYEDLSSQEVEKYTYKFLKEERVGGLACYVVERYPVDKKSGYTRQVSWIDKQEFRAMKTDYYDRKGSRLKTFTATGFKSYAKNFWRADKFLMVNHQTGKRTELIWTDFKFTQSLKESGFTSGRLKNAR